MKRVAFISHSSEDKAVGETVCRFLESHGISCWIAPRDVTPGKNYGAAIVDAIDECDVFILVLSAKSNKSGQVVREVERAASTNSVIIPLRVEPVQPSRDLEFYVSSSHWLDAAQKPLEKHLNALVDAIRDWQNKGEPLERLAPSPSPSSVAAAAQPSPQSRLGLIIGISLTALIMAAIFFMATRLSSSRNKQTTAPVAATSQSQISTPPTTPSESVAAGTPIIERVDASSHLKPQMYLGTLKTYWPGLAFDGDEATAWVPNSSGPGEWIEVFFKAPTLLTSVSIYGGYGVDFARYSTNNRVRQIRIIFPNGGSRLLSLADKMQMQRFDLPHRPVVPSLKFEIISIYRGTKYDSTPISEIAFNRPE